MDDQKQIPAEDARRAFFVLSETAGRGAEACRDLADAMRSLPPDAAGSLYDLGED